MNEEISRILDQVASESPTPGGGSVSALAGALGAALAAMVWRLTERHRDSAGGAGTSAGAVGEVDIQALIRELDDLRRELAAGFDKDAASYQEVLAAYQLPKTNEGESASRQEAIQAAMKRATQVPLENARLCARVMEAARRAAISGYQPSVTDAGVGLLLAFAGLVGCLYNVELNLKDVKDEKFVAELRREAAALRAAAWTEAEGADQTILTRIGA